MSKLEELIQELCPDGVEYKSITDVFDIRGGYTPSKSNLEYWTNGTIPWFRMEDIRENGHVLSKALQYVSQSAVKKNGLFPANSIALATSATIGEHALITVECLGNQRFTFFSCKEKYNKIINMNFMNHYFCVIDEWCKEHLNQGSFASVDMTALKKLEIPVPPLEVQKEIVRLLDDFTAKTAELQAELNKEYEARKKQYEYYRDTLLNDEKTTRKVTLQDVAQYSKARISSSEVNETNYVGVDNLLQNKKGKVNSTHVPTSGNLTEFQSGDILIGNIRPYLQKIWLSDKTGGTNGDVLDIRPNQKLVTPPFLYQVLASDRFFNYDMQNSKGAKMPRGNKEKVMEYTFALPTLERQREIVLLLNKFEIAFNDLQSELPAEIESRQKQYEYYRDKLLTFKELK